MANADEWGRALFISSLVMIITEDAEVNHKSCSTIHFCLPCRCGSPVLALTHSDLSRKPVYGV